MINIKRKALGTYDIAKLCQVTGPTVGRWLDEGEIPFFTTAGGHRRVWNSDLAAFLAAHNIPAPPNLSGEEKIKILIVDDELGVRKFLIRFIGKNFPEADVHEAQNGFEAGHKVASLAPALVILDINLPGIDGYEVCRMIRGDQKTKNVKILAISGDDSAAARKRSLEVGADGFLGKPFDGQALEEGMRVIMEGKRKL